MGARGNYFEIFGPSISLYLGISDSPTRLTTLLKAIFVFRKLILIQREGNFLKLCASKNDAERYRQTIMGPNFQKHLVFQFKVHDKVHDKVLGFTMGSWIHDGFLDSRWVPGFTMGSCIHDGFLDSLWVPGFTMGSWYWAGHGNLWHGTDHRGTARKYLARQGS